MKTLFNSQLVPLAAFLLVTFSSCIFESKTEDPFLAEKEKLRIADSIAKKEAEEKAKKKKYLYSWIEQLALRDSAALEAKSIVMVNPATPLEITGTKTDYIETIVLRGVAYEDQWYKVVTPDKQEGWVFGGAVKQKNEKKGSPVLTDTQFGFSHFGEFNLVTWKKLPTQTEEEIQTEEETNTEEEEGKVKEVDTIITAYQKDNLILEITATEMGEMYYAQNYKLKNPDGKVLKERNFSFTADGRVLEEKVINYMMNMEYSRKQTINKHWYQLNAKPQMVRGAWKEQLLTE